MLPELRKGFDTHEVTRERFLSRVRAAAPVQRSYRATPGTWSMLDVTEHLVLAEEHSVLGVEKGPPPGVRATLAASFRMVLVRGVMDSPIRVKVPVARVLPTGTPALDALEERWMVAARRLAELFERVEQGERGVARFRHPVAGWVGAREGLGFLAAHIRHHERQLGRIQSLPGFPTA